MANKRALIIGEERIPLELCAQSFSVDESGGYWWSGVDDHIATPGISEELQERFHSEIGFDEEILKDL